MRDLRRAAWDRQYGLCAATGLPLGDRDDGPWHLHHRLAGGMGGTSADRDRLSNVVAVLAEAHNLGSSRLPVDGLVGRSIHTDPGWARARGLLLSQHGCPDPAAMPVRFFAHGWRFLRDDGTWAVVA